MIKYIFLFVLFNVSLVFSQDLFIPDNPYDLADEVTKSKNSFNRERWFYEQRMYPNNYIPSEGYTKALMQRDMMRQTQGFHREGAAFWNNIGPTSGSYFTYGNIASRIASVKYDPVNPNIVYLGAAFGGVWKSSNGGINWISRSDYEVSLSSGALAIDPTNSNIIYYGTGEATFSGASYYGRGILKSIDGGNTWTNYTAGLEPLTYFSRIVVRPNHSNEIFAATVNRSSLGVVGGIYKSTNSGLNWTQIVSGRYDDIVFSPTGDTAYAVGSGGGYRISTDGGVTFVTNTTLPMGERNHITICKRFPRILYASRYASSSITVYKSTDAGFNFSQVASGTNFSGSQAWYDFYIYVNPFNPNYAYVGSIDIWRTTNGGTSFENITNGYAGGNVHVDQQNLEFHPTDSLQMLCANDGGIWKSTDRGSTWTNLNASLTLTQFYRIAADPSNAAHILGGTQDNGTQRTTGTLNWEGAFGGDGGEVCFHSQNNSFILGETQNNGVRVSIDGGVSWTAATSGLSGSGAWVAPLLSHPDSAEIFYTARQQVFKTDNWATNWFPISTGTSGVIREMAISKSTPNLMYATSGSQVFKSTDRGYTFTNVTTGLPNRTITSVNIHPTSNAAIVTFSGFGAGKVYITLDGSSWTNISSNLPDSPFNDAMFYFPGVATNILFAAADIGVFITTNNGAVWSELADGLPNTVAMHLDYNQLTNKLRIGSHGRGVYETDMLTNIITYSDEIPDEYMLYQNYPNPFNPSTNIKFSIPNKGLVNIKIYDVLGKETADILNKELTPGSYEINFNASNLSSGIYYYTMWVSLSSGEKNFYETKKMILIK